MARPNHLFLKFAICVKEGKDGDTLVVNLQVTVKDQMARRVGLWKLAVYAYGQKMV